MATKEEQEALRTLVQHVSRAFYESKYTIVMDQLARHPVLKDDDLASRLGVQAKELNKLMAVLANDRLVQVYRRNELKDGAQRSIGKQYYYIDYQHFCNVVKWRISKMRSKIDDTLRNELDNKGYICSQCSKKYTALDVLPFFDPSRAAFVCEDCHADILLDDNSAELIGSSDRMQRFNEQMRFITRGLQKSESIIIPAFDVPSWVRNNLSDADKQAAAQGGPGAGLKVAGSGGGQRQDDGIGVMMSMDKDESTRKMERDAEAAAKRQQNALPAWHLKSTITGDLTALGIQESARAEAAAAATAALNGGSSSNDNILRGLGVVGDSSRGTSTPAFTPVVEDVKPVINHESDLYDQYYASLAASSSSVPSAQDTPSINLSLGDDFGDLPDEEEDTKPSVEYLNSLNDYRKRSRSAEDEGRAGKKMAKTESDVANLVEDVTMAVDNDASEAPPEDDPIVQVNGQPMAFSKVTEEDQELMTPEEYTHYFEVFQARS